jgi:cytochrome c biogenesis protein ResB
MLRKVVLTLYLFHLSVSAQISRMKLFELYHCGFWLLIIWISILTQLSSICIPQHPKMFESDRSLRRQEYCLDSASSLFSPSESEAT